MNDEKKYVLLDWDGNMAQTLSAWVYACKVPLLKRNIHLTDDRIIEGFHSTGIWGVDDLETVLEEADFIAKELLPSISLYPRVVETIKHLHEQRKVLAIVTTAPRRNVEFVLKKYELEHYFNTIVSADDNLQHKPNPEPLERALELLGGTKSQAVMIGDSNRDIEAARALGIDSILFFPSSNKKFYDSKTLQESLPTYTVSNFKDILNFI